MAHGGCGIFISTKQKRVFFSMKKKDGGQDCFSIKQKEGGLDVLFYQTDKARARLFFFFFFFFGIKQVPD